jgi:hypothetical protein
MHAFSQLQFHHSSGRSGLSGRNSCARSGLILTALLWMVIFSCIAATGQNRINTVAGGTPSIGNPTLSDLAGPSAVMEDASGNIYVSSPQEQWIYELTGGQLIVFAGTGYISDHYRSGPANQDPLWSPAALAIDKQGNIYIADTGNNVIREVNSAGIQTVVAGTSKPCLTFGVCGDHGKATSAKLNGPRGVAVDSNGNIYIADTGDNRVRVVNTKGIIEPFASNYNVSRCSPSTGQCGDGGPALTANLNNPMGLAVDSQNNLYIADSSDNRIRMAAHQGDHVITTVAGTGTACFPTTGHCGDGHLATSAQLRGPKAVSVDAVGDFYIADTGDNRIRLVTAGTTPMISTIAGTGLAGFNGEQGTATSMELAAPLGVYVDKAGKVLIGDSGNQRVREVTGTTLNTIIGGPVPNGGDGGIPTNATLADPYTVAVDSADNYYIADQANNRVRYVAGQTITTVAGNGNAGYTGDGGAATAANLNSLEGVALDASENLYIADTGNAVVRCVAGVAGACVGATGGVPVGDINTIAGTGHPCSPSTDQCGDGGPSYDAWLTAPTSVAVDAAGNVFIADASANKIREISGGIITTIAGTGMFGSGTGGGACTYTITNGDPATSANLCNPHGIAVDATDDVYIADAGNNRILCVLGVVGGCGDTKKNYKVGEIIRYAYSGGENFSQCPCQESVCPCKATARQCNRWGANEVALDARGNLFVGGGNDYLVQRIDLATGFIVTVAGIDSQYYYYGFYGDGHPAVDAHIDALGQAVDSHENLLISDAGNNRIREVPMVAVGTASPTSVNFGNVSVGTTSPPQPVTLTNTGADDLNISNISTSANFGQTHKCPKVLAPSQSCTIEVTFTPIQKQVYNGTLTVTHDGYNGQTKVTLSGTGV